MRISDTNRAEVKRQIVEAAELGIHIVGYDKALRAAIVAQHKCCADLFKLIHGVAEGTDGSAILPLNEDVMEVFNNAVGSTQLVAEVLKRDLNRREASENPDSNVIQFPNDGISTKH